MTLIPAEIIKADNQQFLSYMAFDLNRGLLTLKFFPYCNNFQVLKYINQQMFLVI